MEYVRDFLKRRDRDKKDSQESAGPIKALSQFTPSKALVDRYVEEMKKMQFAFLEMIDDGNGQVFKVPYHFQDEARKTFRGIDSSSNARTKRLAEESLTFSKDLPLSYGSSIFLRCDQDRLDVIKVLITGPAGTPYSNGCFEFDIHFPTDYPNSPPMVNFETTGRGRIRFHPNLYENGKICMSILGRGALQFHEAQEEQQHWNPQTSSLLPVLVAIQNMIFVDEPWGSQPQSRECNAKIRYYCMQYAILDQIRKPTGCFKEVIRRHFWMKKYEILAQCEEWNQISNDLDIYSYGLLKETVSALKTTLLTMSPPEGLEDLQFNMNASEEKSSPEAKKLKIAEKDKKEQCRVQ